MLHNIAGFGSFGPPNCSTLSRLAEQIWEKRPGKTEDNYRSFGAEMERPGPTRRGLTGALGS